jgi:hypothetical protein
VSTFIIHADQQIQMKCLKSGSKNFHWRSTSFRQFAVVDASKGCCMCQRIWNTIQRSLPNRLFLIRSNTSVSMAGGKHSEMCRPSWMTRARRISAPADRRDLSPNDFFLFGNASDERWPYAQKCLLELDQLTTSCSTAYELTSQSNERCCGKWRINIH